MNVTKEVPVLFRLFSYSLSVAVVTYRCPRATFSPVQSSSRNAHSDLTTAGSPTPEPCFPLYKKAFSLAQHSPVLYSAAHL